ncbi:hypothetical protein ACQ4PT_036102 [Festuca glaucescens]
MPRRSNATGYTGVRERPSGAFYAEIRFGLERINLGTYETAHEAARAYDAAAWRLGHRRSQVNFQDVWTREQAEDLAPPPRLVTTEDKRRHKALQRQLYHAVEDERLMEEWKRRFPEDIQAMRAFYVERKGVRKASHVARRIDKAECRAFILAQEAGPQTINDNDDMWMDLFSSTPVSDTTVSAGSDWSD